MLKLNDLVINALNTNITEFKMGEIQTETDRIKSLSNKHFDYVNNQIENMKVKNNMLG